MTALQFQQQFHKELKQLLAKYKAELTIEDFGRDYMPYEKMVVNFEWSEDFFNSEDSGIIPQLILGTWENGDDLESEVNHG